MRRLLWTFMIATGAFARTEGDEAIPQPPPARIPTYIVRDLGVLDGYESSWPKDMNESGSAVGYSERLVIRDLLILEDQACLFDGDGVYPFPVFPVFSHATAINNNGVAVGTTNASFGWISENGIVTFLGSLTPVGASIPYDVNDSRQVVGAATPPAGLGYWRPFLWENGVMIDLQTIGGSDTRANAINNHGHIVGTCLIAPGSPRALLWDTNTITELPCFLPESSSRAADINDNNEIVGTCAGTPVIWRSYVAEHLDDPPCVNCGGPSAINNLGHIVGSAGTAQDRRAIIWWKDERYELSWLIPPSNIFDLESAEDVNDPGQILCKANGPGPQSSYSVLLTPTQCDANADGKVDLTDFGSAQNCLTGPQLSPSRECAAVDFDEDLDVDLVDYRCLDLAFEP